MLIIGPTSQPEYCFRQRAVYQAPARVARFHIFKTVETMPRILTVHEHNILRVEDERA